MTIINGQIIAALIVIEHFDEMISESFYYVLKCNYLKMK